jgi:hypothetical protein
MIRSTLEKKIFKFWLEGDHGSKDSKKSLGRRSSGQDLKKKFSQVLNVLFDTDFSADSEYAIILV